MINGIIVKNLRTDQKMSQLELAVKAGITPQTLSYIELQRRNNVRDITIKKLADALGVNIDVLQK